MIQQVADDITYVEVLGPYDSTFYGPFSGADLPYFKEEMRERLDPNVFDINTYSEAELKAKIRAFGPVECTRILMGECDCCGKWRSVTKVWTSCLETWACARCRGEDAP